MGIMARLYRLVCVLKSDWLKMRFEAWKCPGLLTAHEYFHSAWRHHGYQVEVDLSWIIVYQNNLDVVFFPHFSSVTSSTYHDVIAFQRDVCESSRRELVLQNLTDNCPLCNVDKCM